MAFTKFAHFEISEILDVKGSSSRVREASLNKLADFEDFRTEDGYLYARIRAISSRVNKNHDGWPSVELAGGPEVFEKHRYASEGKGFTVEANSDATYGFSTFLGKPIFVDHHNSDPSRARGVIVDTKLHVEDQKTASLDPYYASPDVDHEHTPPTWVELLLEVDANAFPKFAQAIIDGSKDSSTGIDGFSMGCNVERSVCNICKNSASAPDEFCSHIRMKGRNHQYRDPKTGHVKSARSYENCYGVQFFEISGVFDPADETALSMEVRSSLHKEAGEHFDRPCPLCYGEGTTPTGDYCPACEGHATDGQQVPAPVGGDGHYTPTSITPGYSDADDVQAEAMERGLWPERPRHGHTNHAESVTANMKTAENPVPQADLTKAPDQVDTLREEKTCPICGEKLDDGSCDLCGYIEPPQNFDNPDLDRAGEVNQIPAESGPDGNEQKIIPPKNVRPDQPMDPRMVPSIAPNNSMAVSHVKGDMQWKVLPDPRLAGRINNVERPIKPGNAPTSNEPNEVIVKDEARPVTSHVRTAGDFIASVGREQENNMERVADSASATAAPDVRTDVTGVGGITDASNEAASKADAQVDVEGVGGTGVENVDASGSASVEQTSDNAGFQPGGQKGPDTDTWSGTDGNGVTKQLDPVSREPFPASDEGVKKSHDDRVFPTEDTGGDGGLSGGGAVKGVKPVAEQFGERVDVLDHVTSPANNSGPTTQWTGTDGNGVTKQQDPTTSEVFAPWTSKVVSSVRLAELEIDLGLITSAQKWARVAELGQHSDERVATELAYAERVRTAGLKTARTASVEAPVKTAKKLPVLGRPSQMRSTASATDESDPMKGTLFGL